MSNKGYYFDKRKRKRKFAKILILFLLGFFPTVLFNIFVGRFIDKQWLIVFIDCVILLAIILPFSKLLDKYYEKKDNKLAKKIKAREEMEERKKQILEDSYKRKRQEKEKTKAEKTKEENK